MSLSSGLDTYVKKYVIYVLAVLKHAWAAHVWRFCRTCPYWGS